MKGFDFPGAGAIGAILAVQAVRYLAATQSFAMVFFHAGWLLLALATWGDASGSDSTIGGVTRVLIRAYAWLGGVDASGHGDGNSLMAVWAKLGLVIYVVEALWHRVAGPAEPMKLWHIMGISWLVAQLGYVVAMYPTGDLGEGAVVIILFPILAGLSTGWSVAAHRLAAAVEAWIHAGVQRKGQEGT
ncbi:hypothetical protein [Lysobacter sp. A3-1-A15]|uniref:hypothetical protein n=1 Tax=Novilysobacter viscosus TaxID=3098602 RepID=UPI002EDAAADE